MNDQPAQPHGPSFLSELAIDAVLDAAVLRGPVVGPDIIRHIVGAVGSLYTSQKPGFHAVTEDMEIYEYKAVLPHSQLVNGVITVTRGTDGLVAHVGSYMTPLSAVLTIAAALRERFPDLDKSLFI